MQRRELFLFARRIVAATKNEARAERIEERGGGIFSLLHLRAGRKGKTGGGSEEVSGPILIRNRRTCAREAKPTRCTPASQPRQNRCKNRILKPCRGGRPSAPAPPRWEAGASARGTPRASAGRTRASPCSPAPRRAAGPGSTRTPTARTTAAPAGPRAEAATAASRRRRRPARRPPGAPAARRRVERACSPTSPARAGADSGGESGPAHRRRTAASPSPPAPRPCRSRTPTPATSATRRTWPRPCGRWSATSGRAGTPTRRRCRSVSSSGVRPGGTSRTS